MRLSEFLESFLWQMWTTIAPRYHRKIEVYNSLRFRKARSVSLNERILETTYWHRLQWKMVLLGFRSWSRWKLHQNFWKPIFGQIIILLVELVKRRTPHQRGYRTLRTFFDPLCSGFLSRKHGRNIQNSIWLKAMYSELGMHGDIVDQKSVNVWTRLDQQNYYARFDVFTIKQNAVWKTEAQLRSFQL